MMITNGSLAVLRSWLVAVIFLVALVPSAPSAAAPGVLLQRMQEEYTRHGATGVRDLASGMGIVLREEHGRLMVPVTVPRSIEQDPQFSYLLQHASARTGSVSRDWMDILVPAQWLSQLINAFPQYPFRAPFPRIESEGMGSVVSQSVGLTGADGYQAGNLAGAGVRIAVVDLGFQGLSARIAAGELPQNTVQVDFTGSGMETVTRHGTGVAEHVMDMAPGAQLYCLKIDTLANLQNAADYLATNNIRIANHSVNWFLASYYDDSGPVNDIFNQSYDADGVFWTVSAGNMAHRHWRGGWLDADSDSNLDFISGNDALQLAGTSSTIVVYLNWNQYGASSKTDLDLYLLDVNGSILEQSTVRQSRFNDPVEVVTHAYQASEAPYSVQVRRYSGSTSNLDVTIFSPNHNVGLYQAAASQPDPSNAHGAFSVGAINQANWLNASPSIESFSSQGPTTDGRLKPDLVAPDATSSVSYTVASGTSFAAPTVAGAAALLKSENSALTASQLASALRSGAVDIGASGPDTVFGYGKLQLPLIDTDGDLLSNVEELQIGTDPLLADTDADGLSDYAEVNTWGTNPLLVDTDGDGVGDFDEAITFGTDPLISNLADLAPRGSPDGIINAADLLILARLVIGEITPTAAEQAFADLDHNAVLDAGDLQLMTAVVTGQIPVP